ncbi:hypothetical protein EMIHUDRAFT_115965 [Emiliania huxleyi CCMP1516]|uniref:Glycosyl transferase family 1 domain-containing protein n=2 Tax=Emiliania huxleyi TaxID=2903 RepID=A0A0D3JLB8_EMIH1|nr:hypothetical protein EMIHUDRAFT_115965 [Emiliania huxleyi CCMP1516]EOD24303.1 hypothetical protein EMIHUDRAFT_115965 [Emiliania huxleyi CCMP1516]|eukprot:XP_005776732.1 hypothetical protein EMIHUDRAFT_115965 [Emiliania huxleyi CCMP1516]
MTIASALSRRNYSVAYTDASRTRNDIVAEVVRHGSPVVVLFGYWNAVPGTREIVSRAVAKGAHLVLYQSEPLGVLYNRQPLAHNKHILATKELYNASELWDYSLANLEWLRPHVQLTLRHVPPSYVPDFDLGVQATRRGVGVVGTRPPPKTYAQTTAPLWHNVTQAELQTWADMRQFLTTHPLQLVFHRVPQGNLCPFEAFRGAVLASNRACIVAQDSHPLDQHYWAGIVHFAPTPADLPRIVNRFMSDPALLADCQALTYNAFVTNHTATARAAEEKEAARHAEELLAEVEAEKRAKGKKGKKKKNKGGGAGGAGPSQEPEEVAEAPSEADAAEAAKKAEEARLLLLLETLTEERMRLGITAESQAAASAEVAEAARLDAAEDEAEEEAEAEDEAEAAAEAAEAEAEAAQAESKAAEGAARAALEEATAALERRETALEEARAATKTRRAAAVAARARATAARMAAEAAERS